MWIKELLLCGSFFANHFDNNDIELQIITRSAADSQTHIHNWQLPSTCYIKDRTTLTTTTREIRKFLSSNGNSTSMKEMLATFCKFHESASNYFVLDNLINAHNTAGIEKNRLAILLQISQLAAKKTKAKQLEQDKQLLERQSSELTSALETLWSYPVNY